MTKEFFCVLLGCTCLALSWTGKKKIELMFVLSQTLRADSQTGGGEEKYFGLLDYVTASRNKKRLKRTIHLFRADVCVQL